MRRTPNRRLSSVESAAPRPDGPAGPSGSAPAPPQRPDGPAAAAYAALRAAQSALADAEGAVRVAQAQLADTLAATPQENAAVARAAEEVEAARAKAQAAANAVRAAERTAADRAGAVEVAAAKLDAERARDAVDDVKIVEAVERHEKAVRAQDAAREALLDAHESRDTAENLLAAAEERLAQARAVPPRESAAVVAAREKVAKAERARDLAEERVAAARAAYDRAVALESGQDAPAASAPLFASLPTFVDRYVLPNWRHRHDRDTRWCEQWWLHEEAVTRLEALWEAFEAMRLEPAPSLSTWLRDHFDHHMSMLTRADGAFANCAPRTHDDPVHRAGAVWAHTEPPAGLFDVDPESVVQPQSHQQGGVA
ncbi:DUF4913 domain-containing protein [Amycolatopsis sp. A1MSW2902]|uniref:DUF4913 domain-containing protein n=1 Tax=Amycolatopsis sp. A1MSW2902 TaxID=687413 RepID=UPI00307CFB6B